VCYPGGWSSFLCHPR
jgi:hypothetical protein